ncbi:MAG: DUF362 domain-containing protein [Nitrospirota bacterium]
MNRRNFIKATAIAGAGAVFTPSFIEEAFASNGPLVAMAKGTPPASITRAAVDALGGMRVFVSKGDVVVVKPNIGWDRTAAQAADTNPEVVAEVIRMCLEAGAGKVKVFDRTCNDARRCYENSGIGPVVESIKDPRVELSYVDERKYRMVDIPAGRLIRRWPVYEEVLNADKFINVPVAKHHSAALLTMGMKNVLGVIGSNRAVLHREIHDALPDLNRVIKSHLTIIDATRILIANGPQGGRLQDVRQTNTVIASADIVAADTIAATLFGKTPKEVHYLQIAQDEGLGIADINKIRLKKVSV